MSGSTENLDFKRGTQNSLSFGKKESSFKVVLFVFKEDQI